MATNVPGVPTVPTVPTDVVPDVVPDVLPKIPMTQLSQSQSQSLTRLSQSLTELSQSRPALVWSSNSRRLHYAAEIGFMWYYFLIPEKYVLYCSFGLSIASYLIDVRAN